MMRGFFIAVFALRALGVGVMGERDFFARYPKMDGL